jgi:acetyl esterase
MALDRDAEHVLEMVRLSGRPPYETLSVSEARELFLAAREVLAADPPPAADIRALSAPGSNGAASLWLYRGRERPPTKCFPVSSTFLAAAAALDIARSLRAAWEAP